MSEHSLNVRLAEDIKLKYEAAAKDADKDLSTWVRDTLEAALGGDPLADAVREMRTRLGLEPVPTFGAQVQVAAEGP